MLPPDGRVRVIVDGIRPEVDGGAFPAKRIIGDFVIVEADISTDGHDSVAGDVLYRHAQEEVWRRTPMTRVANDRWRGGFSATQVGKYYYTVEGWIDRFETWRSAMVKRIDSHSDVPAEWLIGAGLVEEAASRAAPGDAARLQDWVRMIREGRSSESGKQEILGSELGAIVQRYPDRRFARRYGKDLCLVVDREKAAFSAWYEMFPRSCAPEPGRYGTLRDCEARLPYVAAMGFDVLYLPPIHPIGHTYR